MVTDRTCISGYFTDDDEKAILRYADRNRITKSKALEALIRKAFAEQGKTAVMGSEKVDLLENQIVPNEQIKKIDVQVGRQRELFEKLEEWICELQSEVDVLRKQVKRQNEERVSDDQIAAVTHQPEWKVRLWRHGQMKPRGKRVKQRLAPYCVKDGYWKKRSEHE